MATHWERIDDDYRSWLTRYPCSEEEFNAFDFDRRTNLRQEYRNELRQQQQQQQQHRDDSSWYWVTGAISQPSSHAGARYNLFRFASSDGFYPQGCDASTAFETFPSPREERGQPNILKFSIVFQSLTAAAKFVDSVGSYLIESRGMLRLCDNEGNEIPVVVPTITPIAPYLVTPQNKILLMHYTPRDGDAPDSPVVDVVIGTRSICSEDVTVDVTILSRSDEVFRYQSIENTGAFALADPEGAHIFPRAKCVGKYEWLDDKPFNRLALSRDVHLNFDGTGRGRGKRRRTVQTFAIRPLRNQGGYSNARIDEVDCYEIPLEIVINDNTKADPLLARLKNHAQVNRNENERWTITGADVCLFYPRNRPVDLILEGEQHTANNMPLELVTAVPGVNDLSECWSNSPQNLLSLEAAEVMEKCLCWNYEEALRSWSQLG